MADSTSDPTPVPRQQKQPSPHPKFLDMVIESIQAQTDRKGASLAAIKSFITEKYKTVDPNTMKSNVRKAVMKGLASGIIIRPKTSEEAKGVTGRFKVDKAKFAALNKPKKSKAEKVPATPKPKVKRTAQNNRKSPKTLKTPKVTKSRAVKLDKGKSLESTTVKAKPAAAKGKSKPTAKVSGTKAPGTKATGKKSAATKAPGTKAPAKPTSKAGPSKGEDKTAVKGPKAKKKLDVEKPAKTRAATVKKTTGKSGAGKSGAGKSGAGKSGAGKSGGGKSGAGKSGAGKSGAGKSE